MGDLLLADFRGRSRNYHKCEQGKEPTFELTPLQVEALAIVSGIMSDLTQTIDIPADYDPRRPA